MPQLHSQYRDGTMLEMVVSFFIMEETEREREREREYRFGCERLGRTAARRRCQGFEQQPPLRSV